MAGQEVAHSVADVLFGDVNPSARLPVTLPNKEHELGFTNASFPGVRPDGSSFAINKLPWMFPSTATYTERLEVGYRYYNAHNLR
eukprot:COSAG06_NODE_34_length_31045_cov_28.806469_22_plen_85_part_00